jgi:hypothetical protein
VAASPIPAIDSILEGFPLEVRTLALNTRELVLASIPQVLEQPDAVDKLIGYALGPRLADTICVIQPFRRHVNLGFLDGANLPDPERLLTGAGKRHGHVKITTESDLQSSALARLFQAAVEAHAERARA